MECTLDTGLLATIGKYLNDDLYNFCRLFPELKNDQLFWIEMYRQRFSYFVTKNKIEGWKDLYMGTLYYERRPYRLYISKDWDFNCRNPQDVPVDSEMHSDIIYRYYYPSDCGYKFNWRKLNHELTNIKSKNKLRDLIMSPNNPGSNNYKFIHEYWTGFNMFYKECMVYLLTNFYLDLTYYDIVALIHIRNAEVLSIILNKYYVSFYILHQLPDYYWDYWDAMKVLLNYKGVDKYG